MGEVLFELEKVLRSKQERLTSSEANIILTCKSRALREFTAGALVGSGVTWLASWRLNKFLRLNLSGGAAVVLGLWRFGMSLESCVDHILAIEGSRLQKELANIIVNKYRDDPWRMQLISKHFYSEKVYDDSVLDQPKIRWRYRNYFSDNVAHSQRTHENDSHGESHSGSQNKSQAEAHSEAHSDIHNDSGRKKNDVGSKHVPVNSAVDVIADPLDCVFGHMTTAEEIRHPNTSSTQTEQHTHSHKRSHRRRRMRHHDNL
ncbi:Mitochondrial intermediate peptidase [Melia azedarach]|uniref:Mitochondrial intermediate peptidase n=1 Tax=Melia azedarach TaxID=155640 RepID=A0ACC1YFA8_MELAZ|nr:Mitochondrial intermediate peptidase [Melia azedarach]